MGGRLQSRVSQRAAALTPSAIPDPETPEGGVRRRAPTNTSEAAGTGAGANADQSGGEGVGSQLNEKRHSTIVEFSHIDENDKSDDLEKASSSKDHDKQHHDDDEDHHHRTLTERLHGHRPDRHLFPYRSAKENYRAARTFLRRFFFLFLIIPAWVLPNVMMKKAEHELELAHGSSATTGLHGGNLTTPFVSFSGAAEAGAHGPELSIGVNIATFILNMFLMMHLGKAACAALEELVPKFGMSIVSVLDAMTSSTVELAVATFALRKGLIEIVQAAMLGAILNNLLLMLGIAIFIGGIYNHQQELKKETTQASVNILLLTSIAYVVPVALDKALMNARSVVLPAKTDPSYLARFTEIKISVDEDILKLSKTMAILLLCVYVACLLYQYHSRTFMVTPEAKHEGPHTVEHRYTHFWFAGVAYVCLLSAQIYSAYLLVHAVEGFGRQCHLNDSFVGFILLPIVLMADMQEDVIAIRESRSNRLDKAVSLMVGSCMQISLLVTPILVILGWIMDEPMTFRFGIMEVVILAGSVVLVNYLIADHETNWMEGVMLISLFLMCALAFYYIPPQTIGKGLKTLGEATGGDGGGGGGGGGH
ncbi:hypothetical protein BGZ95_002920 [Linnemannia exigua]|uniref:Sodium/calcium exchanger membrane region domain-containing protein n=1 Tax=Linnemannia exigua TaxID=604196 RepID=A0AAD4DIH2_9FUNG|nr:hypothetical protein BGZ95_002920 [Linnemannia exigua]